MFVYIFFRLVCLYCYVFPQPYTIYAYGTILPCVESAVKHQASKQTNKLVIYTPWDGVFTERMPGEIWPQNQRGILSIYRTFNVAAE